MEEHVVYKVYIQRGMFDGPNFNAYGSIVSGTFEGKCLSPKRIRELAANNGIGNEVVLVSYVRIVNNTPKTSYTVISQLHANGAKIIKKVRSIGL